MTTPAVPGRKPANPNFSSGPCAKRPGWSLEALRGAALGRSHRAKGPKAKLKLAIDLFNGLNDRSDVRRMTDHIGIRKVDENKIVAGIDLFDRLIRNSFRTHLWRQIMRRYIFARRKHYVLLSGIWFFLSPIQKIGRVGKLLSFSDMGLSKVRF